MLYFIIMKICEVGEFIAKRRKALKVSQRELAKLAGISEHALCLLERGSGNPTLKTLLEVADTLGLEISLAAKNLEGSCEA